MLSYANIALLSNTLTHFRVIYKLPTLLNCNVDEFIFSWYKLGKMKT